MAKPQKRSAVDPFQVLLDYERRSLVHEPGRPELVEAPGHWRGVGFRIGKRRLVAAFDDVLEILNLPAITPVPGAQPWMLGVANARSNLFPVVDLRLFLEGERTVVNEGQRALVIRQPGGNVAIVIDELFGQRVFNDSHRCPLENMEGRYANFVVDAYRLGEITYGVFSMSTLTRTPEFRQAAA